MGIEGKGVYSLLFFIKQKTALTVGALGLQNLPSTLYVYTGSAFGPGGLKARLKHHINKSYNRRSWHIDFLLTHKNTILTAIMAAQSNNNMECEINRFIKEKGGAKIPVPGFGASDCKNKCVSHLLFFPDISNPIRKVRNAYTHFGLSIIEWGNE